MLHSATSFRYNDYWIGLIRGNSACDCDNPDVNCVRCQNSWKWLDGTPMSQLSWSTSLGFEPNTESCARMNAEGWADLNCDAKFPYICEKYIRKYEPLYLKLRRILMCAPFGSHLTVPSSSRVKVTCGSCAHVNGSCCIWSSVLMCAVSVAQCPPGKFASAPLPSTWQSR